MKLGVFPVVLILLSQAHAQPAPTVVQPAVVGRPKN